MTLDSETLTAQPRWPTSLLTARSVRRLAGCLLLMALSSAVVYVLSKRAGWL